MEFALSARFSDTWTNELVKQKLIYTCGLELARTLHNQGTQSRLGL